MTVCDFSGDLIKAGIRERNIKVYQANVGVTLPNNRRYVTLCGYQNDGGELTQAVSMGFLTLGQFDGVDRSKAVILHNRTKFPMAYWFQLTWRNVLPKLGSIGYAYYDSTHYAGNPTFLKEAQFTLDTVRWKNAFVVLNACNRTRRKSSTILLDGYKELLSKNLDLTDWEMLDSYTYKRRSARTAMLSASFVRLRGN